MRAAVLQDKRVRLRTLFVSQENIFRLKNVMEEAKELIDEDIVYFAGMR